MLPFRRGEARKVTGNNGRASVNKPEAELVQLEEVDAVNMAKASCVIEGQLAQTLQGSQA